MNETEKIERELDQKMAASLEKEILSNPEIKQIRELCEKMQKKYAPHLSGFAFGLGISQDEKGELTDYTFLHIIINTYGSIAHR